MHLLASTVSNGRMTVQYEMEECRKEATMCCYKAVYWHITARSGESHTRNASASIWTVTCRL